MPRPLSVIVTASPPLCSVSVMASACPLRYSSTALSTISQTRWCSPLLSTPPMYMDGRLRTGSRPSRTMMSLPVYVAALIALVPNLFRTNDPIIISRKGGKTQRNASYSSLRLRAFARDDYWHYQFSKNVPCCSPLVAALSFPLVGFPSTASQSTSSIGGGTPRTKVVRFTASKPLPPRDVTSYLAGPHSMDLPPDVSSTHLSKRPPITAPPRPASP